VLSLIDASLVFVGMSISCISFDLEYTIFQEVSLKDVYGPSLGERLVFILNGGEQIHSVVEDYLHT